MCKACQVPSRNKSLRKSGKLILLLFGLGLLSACALAPQAASTLPTPTQTAPPSNQANGTLEPAGTSTPTINWFPPTATYTLAPTQGATLTPTLEVSLERGDLLFTDDFAESDMWSLGRTAAGSAAIAKGRLTLAVSSEEGYVYSLRRQPELGNFFAEVQASPNLCRGGDEYGLLVRVSASLEFYRFSVTCDGQVRLDRYVSGRASSPKELTPSSAAPPGAPSSSRLSVLAIGKELQFFINDEHQYTVRDPSLVSGQLGLFARAAGDSPVTINFSDLKVYEPAD